MVETNKPRVSARLIMAARWQFLATNASLFRSRHRLDDGQSDWHGMADMFEHLFVHALGHTRAGQFFNMMMLFLVVLALPLASVAGLTYYAWTQLAAEADYQRRFTEGWQAQFETDRGSLNSARVKAAVAVLGAVANTVLGVWLYRQLILALRDASSNSHTLGQPRRRQHR